MDTTNHNKLIQWNCRGIKVNYNELLLLISLFSPQVLCIQETKLKQSDIISFNNYSAYHYIHNDGQIASGGTSILVKSDTPHSSVDLTTNLQAKAIKVSLSKSITICSIYVPPQTDLDQNDLENLILQLPRPFILMGDFNGHNQLWGCSDLNDKGKIIEDFITENDLCLFNENKPTYLHPAYGSYSAIDLSICHPSLYLDFEWSVCDDLHGSDHFPIIVKEIEDSNDIPLPRWNFKKANWEKFKSLCENRLHTEDFLNESDPIMSFSESLLNISKECIPKSTTIPKKNRPWFNEDCKEAIKNRKSSLKKFNRQPTSDNLNITRIMRAKARRTIKIAKRTSWQKYVSKINSRTPMKKIWNMLRKINGKNKKSAYTHIKTNDTSYETKKDIADILGKTFQHNSSSDHYNILFQNLKARQEENILNFESENKENYNLPFSLDELSDSLQSANDSAAGSDDIHYQILKHLPDSSLGCLLDIFNYIWKKGSFPKCWSEAVIIPIPKPNKDHTDPTNYRPIALTSCVCKTMERMINKRLVWYLEANNLISRYQTGFRKNRSTNDQLVRLETFIRNGFIRKQHVVAIFFDLEKAYDTTWKYGIMKDLHQMGLRGHLTDFISNFLSNRAFKVRVGSTLSDTYNQEQGVPQGSILSPTLFNIKINNITKCLDNDVNCSLYVDDFLICYRSKDMENIEKKLQESLNKIEKWATENGFKFSKTKTQCVHFCQQRNLHHDPSLKIYNAQIPVCQEAKFLGVIFDRKLTFIPHIKALKLKCLNALNVLKVISSTNWGGDKSTLLNLYRSLIRSKLDYGSIIYGSARKSYLKSLDTIHHQGLRLALGAFRTSPIESLYAEACEPSLYVRREKLSLQYLTKLAADPRNPAYVDVFYPLYKQFYQNRPNAIKPFGLRMEPVIKEAGINIHNVAKLSPPKTEPWTLKPPKVVLELNQSKKSETDPLVFKNKFLEIKSRFHDHMSFYTDGSKQDDKVACSATNRYEAFNVRLPDKCSIFSAEATAINLALISIRDTDYDKFIIFSDSLSVLKSLKHLDHINPLIQQILKRYFDLSSTKTIIFCWIPSHINIKGNEEADKEAKIAINQPAANIKIPFTDFKHHIRIYIRSLCQNSWVMNKFNKLFQIKPNFFDTYPYPANRKEQVVLTRCRIGHSYVTHSFILKNEEKPQCISCVQDFTINHILIECVDFKFIRNNFFHVNTITELFNKIHYSQILSFLKEIKLFNKL